MKLRLLYLAVQQKRRIAAKVEDKWREGNPSEQTLVGVE